MAPGPSAQLFRDFTEAPGATTGWVGVSATGYNNFFGKGIVDALKAVTLKPSQIASP